MTDVRDEATQARDSVLEDKIRKALIATHGNKQEAAERVGMPRRSFYRWLERLGLKPRPNPSPKRKSRAKAKTKTKTGAKAKARARAKGRAGRAG